MKLLGRQSNMTISMKNLTVVFIKAVRLLLRFLAGAVGFLAGSAQADRDDDDSRDPAQGGILNYRTGKLDDGTDPYGWYKRD